MTDLVRDPLAAELLSRIDAVRAGGTIPHLFDGCSPKWAVAAADRLRAAGLVHADAGGVLTLTPRGRLARQARPSPVVVPPPSPRPRVFAPGRSA